MTRHVMPQRLVASPIRYGDLAKRTREKPQQLAPIPDRAHIDCIRQLPCLKCGLEPCNEAAHVRMNSAALGKRQALGKRPSDEWTVPLCRACHLTDADALHKIGERPFWDALGINPLFVAQDLYAAECDLVRMRAIVLRAIAERDTSDNHD